MIERLIPKPQPSITSEAQPKPVINSLGPDKTTGEGELIPLNGLSTNVVPIFTRDPSHTVDL